MAKFTPKDFLGFTVKDRITGVTGVATGYVSYLTGCNQVLISQPVGADGKLPDGLWFDEQRLERTTAERITLDNGDAPGADTAPTPRAAPPVR